MRWSHKLFAKLIYRLNCDAADVQQFENHLRALTGRSDEDCKRFAMITPRGLRTEIERELIEGMSFDKAYNLMYPTFSAARWRLDVACDDFLRALLGLKQLSS